MSSAVKKIIGETSIANEVSISEDTLRKETILIIDDSLESIQLLQASLKKKFHVIPLSTSELLIQSINNHKPDMILVDLHMPNIDGFEVISQIQRHPLLDSIPIVAMSGTADLAERQRLEQIGVVGFLQKPFYVGTLAGQMDGILQGLNSTIVSESKKRIWHHLFNIKYKKMKMNELIQNAINNNRPSIIISWDDPENFLKQDLKQTIDHPNLSFIQFKPTLIPRFPYLNSFSSVVDEIFELSGLKDGSIDLIIGDPLRILRMTNTETTASQLSQFLREIEFRVQTIHVLHVRSPITEYELMAHQLLQLYIG